MLLLPLAVEGDYLRLARFDAETEATTPLGWLRLHDDDGLLTVWFIYVDLY